MPDPFDRFTPRARRVLQLAADEAETLRHAEIGAEHLLLALIREGRGLGALALRGLGLDPDDVRRRLESRLRPGEVPSDTPLGLSPGAKHAIEMAVVEANRLRHDYLGTEHILLGLLRGGEGTAFVTLESLGVTLERARREVIKLINETPSRPERVTRAGVFGMVRGMRGARGVGQLEVEVCRRCERPGRPDWLVCPFCGEPRPRCGRCDAPVPQLADVKYCPRCGGAVETDEPA